jgi:uncharacterized protein
MPLSDLELRVLGALVEKERTTPDAYPLSSQALRTACNQRTSRDPVTDYHLQEVQDAAFRLRERGFVATVQEAGDRVPKHRHLLQRVLGVDDLELALLAVLMLRGPQTPGELRGRVERYGTAGDAAEVTEALRRLAERSAPLVENLGRGPGQSQDRWRHTLGADEVRLKPRVRNAGAAEATAPTTPRPARAPQPPGDAPSAPAARDAAADASDLAGPDLAARLDALERRVAALEHALGSDRDAASRDATPRDAATGHPALPTRS